MIICESEDLNKNMILKVRKVESEINTFVSCRISVLDSQGAEALVRTTHHSFVEGLQIISQHLFDRQEIKDSYWQEDTLSLRFVLNVQTEKGSETISQIVHESPIDENLEEYINKELIKDYENMFFNGNFSDVKVNAGGKVINCHKSILCARSPVMNDLLDKADQASDGCVIIDIDDLDGDTVERMIYFMYSDKINNINPTIALKLFLAGHKYQIKYLKQKCSLYLKTAFTFENVYDILVAAHIYEDGSLKRNAISYISEYFSVICLTPEWSNFRKSEKELAAYTCLEIRRMKNL
ncbi:protein maternal effect lethal 26-like [Argiope bruennichi]|uniref:protein maternal effect lethal 26-like n=1 Tax=Argiope bruennichi TaxID=94029 RepID=UPI0024946563|nr:protein maternal effect lethal 26-like [Argiope bruennichi]